jgi:hypothetical protein
MNARIKELIRDANTQITPADRNAILGLIEGLEADNKKLAHERAVYLAVLEGQEFRKLDEMPNRENAVERARGIGEEAKIWTCEFSILPSNTEHAISIRCSGRSTITRFF